MVDDMNLSSKLATNLYLLQTKVKKSIANTYLARIFNACQTNPTLSSWATTVQSKSWIAQIA